MIPALIESIASRTAAVTRQRWMPVVYACIFAAVYLGMWAIIGHGRPQEPIDSRQGSQNFYWHIEPGSLGNITMRQTTEVACRKEMMRRAREFEKGRDVSDMLCASEDLESTDGDVSLSADHDAGTLSIRAPSWTMTVLRPSATR